MKERLRRDGTILLVANYPSDVGYAWWLMEAFWSIIAAEARTTGRRCVLAYPTINVVPEIIKQSQLELVTWTVQSYSLADALRGAAKLRRLGVTSVYLTDWSAYSYLYLIWRISGVRCIVVHSHTAGDRPAIRGLKAWFKSFIHLLRIFSCDLYVGVSDHVCRRFTEYSRVPMERCVTVRNGIQPFACSSADRATQRSRVGVPEGALLVVLASRATINKGWDFAIRCVPALVAHEKAERPVHLVFCGDGPDLPSFERLAETLNVAHRCHFLGRRSDVREILCAADIAFHPSHGEALSLATLEFMCAGLPVVLPDRPSVCGLVRHDIDGIVYPAENVGAAVQAIETLAQDPELRRRLGCEARATVLTGYCFEHTMRSFRKLVASRL